VKDKTFNFVVAVVALILVGLILTGTLIGVEVLLEEIERDQKKAQVSFQNVMDESYERGKADGIKWAAPLKKSQAVSIQVVERLVEANDLCEFQQKQKCSLMFIPNGSKKDADDLYRSSIRGEI